MKSKMEVALKRVQEQFPAYCETAPQEDIDCISRGTEMMSDPKCKRALDAMKKMFAVE